VTVATVIVLMLLLAVVLGFWLITHS